MSTRPAGGDTLVPPGQDPLGSAARLRLARLDADVLGPRALHVLVDTVCLLLLLAVPVLATLVAVSITPSAARTTVVPAIAVGIAGAAVLVGFAVLWPHHDAGRTAGMRWAGLRVVDRVGREPSRRQLAVRAACIPVDLLVGPLLVLVRADRRRLGDLLVGTQVVRDLGARSRSGPPAR